MMKSVLSMSLIVTMGIWPGTVAASDTRVVDSGNPPQDRTTRVVDSDRHAHDSNIRPPSAGAPPETLHVTAGFSVAMFSGGIASLILSGRDPGVRATGVAATAFGSALTAGVAKEIADMAGFGTPSVRDVILTAAGGAVGTLLVTAGAWVSADRHSVRTTAAASTATGIAFSVPVQLDLLSRIFHH